MFASFLTDMKNGGGWADILLYGCAEMGEVLRLVSIYLITAVVFGVG